MQQGQHSSSACGKYTALPLITTSRCHAAVALTTTASHQPSIPPAHCCWACPLVLQGAASPSRTRQASSPCRGTAAHMALLPSSSTLPSMKCSMTHGRSTAQGMEHSAAQHSAAASMPLCPVPSHHLTYLAARSTLLSPRPLPLIPLSRCSQQQMPRGHGAQRTHTASLLRAPQSTAAQGSH